MPTRKPNKEEEKMLLGLADTIQKAIGDKRGFALICFEYSPPVGSEEPDVFFASDSKQEFVLTVMQDFIDRHRPPVMPPGESTHKIH